MAAKGNDIIVFKNGTAIAGTRSDEITVGCETIEIASATSGSWREHIAGRKNWSVTVNYLLPYRFMVHDHLMQVGNTYTLIIKPHDDDASVYYLTGTAILTQCKITATKMQLIQGTFTFLGSSELSGE